MATPRQHIEEIRRNKFSIGGPRNPLTEDLHEAVEKLSTELYAKDMHFIMELLQNAEDNEYFPDTEPYLEFIITSLDITGTGAPSTLLVFNNEKGFSKKDIDALCSVARSTKAHKGDGRFIGHKGIGFKSVFLISKQPYVFSNGYQIRFNEAPDPDCGIGYIVPEWVQEMPTTLDIGEVYGSVETLPKTTIILPLKQDKVAVTKNYLSSLHPELLLFLSKVKQISVHEYSDSPRELCSMSTVSASFEVLDSIKKDKHTDAHVVKLCASEGKWPHVQECKYYLWKQIFPVKWKSHVDCKKGMENWEIVLAFPMTSRITRDHPDSGIYAYMPTEIVTGFPFIIQADFILTSSRESIIQDNKWNLGILDCVPEAFASAVVSYARYGGREPMLDIQKLLDFLPLHASRSSLFETVRQSIGVLLLEKDFIPCEPFFELNNDLLNPFRAGPYSEIRELLRPDKLGRLLPDFWSIVNRIKGENISLGGIPSDGKHVISHALDHNFLNNALCFLGVEFMSYDWYVEFISSSNILSKGSESLYLELLCFVANHWGSGFLSTRIKDIGILKYMNHENEICLLDLKSTAEDCIRLMFAANAQHISWLLKGNKKFAANIYFLPQRTQEALNEFSQRAHLKSWLLEVAKVKTCTVSSYCQSVVSSMREKTNSKSLLSFTDFLCQSFRENYLTDDDDGVAQIFNDIPIVDVSGTVRIGRNCILDPTADSRWRKLLGSNPWVEEEYYELSNEYEHDVKNFLAKRLEVDLPNLIPPNAALPAATTQLSKNQAFLLLQWIKHLTLQGKCLPQRFLESISSGEWLKTEEGYHSPNECRLGHAIDRSFYGNEINLYEEELKMVGVTSRGKRYCFIM